MIKTKMITCGFDIPYEFEKKRIDTKINVFLEENNYTLIDVKFTCNFGTPEYLERKNNRQEFALVIYDDNGERFRNE